MDFRQCTKDDIDLAAQWQVARKQQGDWRIARLLYPEATTFGVYECGRLRAAGAALVPVSGVLGALGMVSDDPALEPWAGAAAVHELLAGMLAELDRRGVRCAYAMFGNPTLNRVLEELGAVPGEWARQEFLICGGKQ